MGEYAYGIGCKIAASASPMGKGVGGRQIAPDACDAERGGELAFGHLSSVISELLAIKLTISFLVIDGQRCR